MKFEDREKLIPGGVSSPARAFGAVGGDPVVAASARGAYLTDDDGNTYVDYIQGFGAVILGHADPRVTEAITKAAERGGAVGLATEAEAHLASLIVAAMPAIERVRFVTSGTEASMTAARIARAATGRALIVKFEGNYHGHADAFLAKAGSGVATFSVPMAAGVPETSVADTIVVPYNDVAALEQAFSEHAVAAVFVEPVAANMGVVAAERGFLDAIIDLCRKNEAVSIFDEVVTGFRVGPSGARPDLRPDLTMLGKVIGGGLPIGAVGGRSELMDLLSPVGPVYQAGTFAAHPHAMAAGAAVLEALDQNAFATLEATATRLADGLTEAVKDHDATVVRAGTFLSLFFAADKPGNFEDVDKTDRAAFARFHRSMRSRRVLLAPSAFEAWFPSLAHSDEDIDTTIRAAREAAGEAL